MIESLRKGLGERSSGSLKGRLKESLRESLRERAGEGLKERALENIHLVEGGLDELDMPYRAR